MNNFAGTENRAGLGPGVDASQHPAPVAPGFTRTTPLLTCGNARRVEVTGSNSQPLLTEPALVARCQWCERRIGQASVRLNGVWLKAREVEFEMPGWYEWTDGICPTCRDLWVAKMTQASRVRFAARVTVQASGLGE
jgi:hypothetical protein